MVGWEDLNNVFLPGDGMGWEEGNEEGTLTRPRSDAVG
jgi:hypothetical protein